MSHTTQSTKIYQKSDALVHRCKGKAKGQGGEGMKSQRESPWSSVTSLEVFEYMGVG